MQIPRNLIVRLRIAAAVAVVLMGLPARSFAQSVVEIVFSSPPSPVGAGARATGAGSAFIAVADDATAASWNPGGLTQLEKPELSVVTRGVAQTDKLGSGTQEGVINDVFQVSSVYGGTDGYQTIGLNFLSAAVPFEVWQRNVVIALDYQQMLSFDRELSFYTQDTNEYFDLTTRTHMVQEGGLDTFTSAIGVQVVPEFSIGAALNYWMDGLGHDYAWRQTIGREGAFTNPDGSQDPLSNLGQDTFKNFDGLNASFGLLWRIVDPLSFGAVIKLPFTAYVDHVVRFPNDPTAQKSFERHRIEFPVSYGGGMSYRPVDHLTLSTDLTYVEWGQFRAFNSAGEQFLVTGDPATQYSVDGTLTARLGAEYVWNLSWSDFATRGGLFFDPEPSRGAPKPFYGFSLGLGSTFETISIDFAYQLRFGLDAENTAVTTQILDIGNVPLDTFQHQFYLSLIHYF